PRTRQCPGSTDRFDGCLIKDEPLAPKSCPSRQAGFGGKAAGYLALRAIAVETGDSADHHDNCRIHNSTTPAASVNQAANCNQLQWSRVGALAHDALDRGQSVNQGG